MNISEKKMMFSNRDLAKLLLPLMLEQLLTTLMGTVDTMMVSTVGSAAISAVSLVDSINILLIQLFGALAGGGAIICAQYIGKKDIEKAKNEKSSMLQSFRERLSVAVSSLNGGYVKCIRELIR